MQKSLGVLSRQQLHCLFSFPVLFSASPVLVTLVLLLPPTFRLDTEFILPDKGNIGCWGSSWFSARIQLPALIYLCSLQIRLSSLVPAFCALGAEGGGWKKGFVC